MNPATFFASTCWGLHRPILEQLEARFKQAALSGRLLEPKPTAIEHGDRRIEFADLQALRPSEVMPPAETLITNGVAVIPIHGLMLKRTMVHVGWFSDRVIIGTDDWFGMFEQLVERTDVKAIVFDFDTGGGQVAGTERFASAIFAARATKPIVAVINEMSCSCGMWLAAACERVVLAKTGLAGSIGIYKTHTDWSKWEAEAGIQTTVIHAGRYKAAELRTLTDDLRNHEQGIVDRQYSEFVDSIARFRGATADEVHERMADGRCFVGAQALDAGLCDSIGTLDEVLAELSGEQTATVLTTDKDPEEGTDPMAKLKLNDSGAILGGDGKPVGDLKDVEGLGVDQLVAYFPDLCEALGEKAVAAATEGIEKAATDAATKALTESATALQAAFPDDPEHALASLIAGHDVNQAKAAGWDRAQDRVKAAEERATKAEQKQAELARAPGFQASDATGAPAGKVPEGDDADKTEARQRFAKSTQLQAEFGGDFDVFYAYDKAERNGSVRPRRVPA